MQMTETPLERRLSFLGGSHHTAEVLEDESEQVQTPLGRRSHISPGVLADESEMVVNPEDTPLGRRLSFLGSSYMTSESEMAQGDTTTKDCSRRERQGSRVRTMLSLRRSESQRSLVSLLDDDHQSGEGQDPEEDDDLLPPPSSSAKSRGRRESSLNRRRRVNVSRSRSRSRSKSNRRKGSGTSPTPSSLGYEPAIMPDNATFQTKSLLDDIASPPVERKNSLLVSSFKDDGKTNTVARRNSLVDTLPTLKDERKNNKLLFWDDTTISTKSSGGFTMNSLFNPIVVYRRPDVTGEGQNKSRRLFRSNSDRHLDVRKGGTDEDGCTGKRDRLLSMFRRNVTQRTKGESDTMKAQPAEQTGPNRIQHHRNDHTEGKISPNKMSAPQRSSSDRYLARHMLVDQPTKSSIKSGDLKATGIKGRGGDGPSLQDSNNDGNRLVQRSSSDRYLARNMLAEQSQKSTLMPESPFVESSNANGRRSLLPMQSPSVRSLYGPTDEDVTPQTHNRGTGTRHSDKVDPLRARSAHARLNALAKRQGSTKTIYANDSLRVSAHSRLERSNFKQAANSLVVGNGMRRSNTTSGGLMMSHREDLDQRRGSVNAAVSRHGSGMKRSNTTGVLTAQPLDLKLNQGRGSLNATFSRNANGMKRSNTTGMRRSNTTGGGLSMMAHQEDLDQHKGSVNATFSRPSYLQGRASLRLARSSSIRNMVLADSSLDSTEAITNRFHERSHPMRRCMSGDSLSLTKNSTWNSGVQNNSGKRMSQVKASLRKLEASLNSNTVDQQKLSRVEASLQKLEASLGANIVNHQSAPKQRSTSMIESFGISRGGIGYRLSHQRVPSPMLPGEEPEVGDHPEGVSNDGRQARNSTSKRLLSDNDASSGGLERRTKTGGNARRSSARAAIGRKDHSKIDAPVRRLKTCENPTNSKIDVAVRRLKTCENPIKRNNSGGCLHGHRGSLRRTVKKIDGGGNDDGTTKFRRVKSAQDTSKICDGEENGHSAGKENYTYESEVTTRNASSRLTRSNSNPESDCSLTNSVSNSGLGTSKGSRRSQTSGGSPRTSRHQRSSLLSDNENPDTEIPKHSRSRHKRSKSKLRSGAKTQPSEAGEMVNGTRSKRGSSTKRRSSSREAGGQDLMDGAAALEVQKTSRPKRGSSMKVRSTGSNEAAEQGHNDEAPGVESSKGSTRPRRRSSMRHRSNVNEDAEQDHQASKSKHRSSSKSRSSGDDLAKRSSHGSHKRRSTKLKRTSSVTEKHAPTRGKPDQRSSSTGDKKKRPSSTSDLTNLDRITSQGKEHQKSKSKEEIKLTLEEIASPKSNTRSDCNRRWSQLDSGTPPKLALGTLGGMPNQSASSGWGDSSASSFCSDMFSIPTVEDDDFSIPTILSGLSGFSGAHEDGSKKSGRQSAKVIKRAAAAEAILDTERTAALLEPHRPVDTTEPQKTKRLLQLQKTWKNATTQLVNTTS